MCRLLITLSWVFVFAKVHAASQSQHRVWPAASVEEVYTPQDALLLTVTLQEWTVSYSGGSDNKQSLHSAVPNIHTTLIKHPTVSY
jgi:hypothetical protein